MTDPRDIPQPRSRSLTGLSAYDLNGKAIHSVLSIGTVEVLFSYAKPLAIWSAGGDVFFPDVEMSRTSTKHLNAFHRSSSRTRVIASEFDFILASALMGQLRPLTRGPQ